MSQFVLLTTKLQKSEFHEKRFTESKNCVSGYNVDVFCVSGYVNTGCVSEYIDKNIQEM